MDDLYGLFPLFCLEFQNSVHTKMRKPPFCMDFALKMPRKIHTKLRKNAICMDFYRFFVS